MDRTKSFAFLALYTALTISAIAIYYSLAGLIAIFSAAPVGIAILGGALEISKLVIVVWLHQFWQRSKWWLKTYLVAGILILMVLTSVGIFGFLSKAHTEQASASAESTAQIERITSEVARQRAIIQRAEEKINKTETVGSGADVQIQTQIDKEQGRIDKAFERIKESENSLSIRVTPFQNELTSIGNTLSSLQIAIDNQDIKKAQSIVGTRTDGQYGPRTAAKVQAYRAGKDERRRELLEKIDEIRTTETPAVSIARTQVKDSTALINRLRSQLGQSVSEDLDQVIDDQTARIKKANTELDGLIEKKYVLEAANRELEADVGPIKFVANFIFGETEKRMLERAVSWLIVLIVIVFDPLAVMLLIASQYTFAFWREDNPGNENKYRPNYGGKYADMRDRVLAAGASAMENLKDKSPRPIAEHTGKGAETAKNWTLKEGHVDEFREADPIPEDYDPAPDKTLLLNQDDQEIIDKIAENPELMADPEVQEQLDQDPELLAKVEQRILTAEEGTVKVKDNEPPKQQGWIDTVTPRQDSNAQSQRDNWIDKE